MATAADVVMGFSASTLVPAGSGVVTVDLNISFMDPGVGDELLASGRVIKAGNRVFFCECDITVVNKGVAVVTNKATATMYRFDPPVNN